MAGLKDLSPGKIRRNLGVVEPRRLLDELLRVAHKLGVEVRMEPFRIPGPKTGAGGICRLHGRTVILIDSASSLADQTRAMAEALGELELGDVYMAPEARELVAQVLRSWHQPRASRSETEPTGAKAVSPAGLIPDCPRPGIHKARPRSQ